jgi:2-haloacid dehalogenase
MLFAAAWREKQIEYLFRRGLGDDYVDFAVCTSQALEHTCLKFGAKLSRDNKRELLSAYTSLPAYPGVQKALRKLRHNGCRNFAFSNGTPDDLDTLLEHAELLSVLDGVVSVHIVRSFKPDPIVYAHFLAETGATPDDTWLVSANPFDVIGAHNAGWRTVWVQREPRMVFDPWGIEPTRVVTDVGALNEIFA